MIDSGLFNCIFRPSGLCSVEGCGRGSKRSWPNICHEGLRETTGKNAGLLAQVWTQKLSNMSPKNRTTAFDSEIQYEGKEIYMFEAHVLYAVVTVCFVPLFWIWIVWILFKCIYVGFTIRPSCIILSLCSEIFIFMIFWQRKRRAWPFIDISTSYRTCADSSHAENRNVCICFGGWFCRSLSHGDAVWAEESWRIPGVDCSVKSTENYLRKMWHCLTCQIWFKYKGISTDFCFLWDGRNNILLKELQNLFKFK
jgi:hypothetical protein